MSLLEEEYLLSVNQLIENRLLVTKNSEVGEEALKSIGSHLCVSKNAKRARPLLCLYYHLMMNENLSSALSLVGAAAEFIHAASLLHDDVIDEADSRRGKKSANALFGNKAAVLAGNYLLTESFYLLRGLDRIISDQAMNVVHEMTKAAIVEVNTRGRIDLSEEEWRLIAFGKTGKLFSFCGYAAGVLCGRLHDAHRLYEVGQDIGHLFQMADDLKDFCGDNQLKDECRDILNREPNYPIILAMKKSPAIKKSFEEAFQKPVIDKECALKLKEQVLNSGAILDTQEMMKQGLARMMDALSVYDNSLGKKYFDTFARSISVGAWQS